jgi:hypothetical protein
MRAMIINVGHSPLSIVMSNYEWVVVRALKDPTVFQAIKWRVVYANNQQCQAVPHER